MLMKIDMWPDARWMMLRGKTGEPGSKNFEKKKNVPQAEIIRMTMTVTKMTERSTRGAVMKGLRARYLTSYIGRIHGYTLSLL